MISSGTHVSIHGVTVRLQSYPFSVHAFDESGELAADFKLGDPWLVLEDRGRLVWIAAAQVERIEYDEAKTP